MQGYEKQRLPRIIFGDGTHDRVKDLVKEFNITKCLVVTDEGVRKLGIVDKIIGGFEDVEVVIYDKVEPNPHDVTPVKVAKLIRQENINGVIGIGGGSPMDVAKGACLISCFDEDPDDIERLYDYRRGVGPKFKVDWKRNIPLITVPTTSGTGAEATSSTAFSDSVTNLKFSFGNEAIAPDVAVIDPTFTLGMPKIPTVNGALDALAHATEDLLGAFQNEYSDTIMLKCIEKVFKWLPVAVKDPMDQEARDQLSWAACNSLSNGALPNGHALAHALGAMYGLVHGHACAMVLPAVIRHHAVTAQSNIAEICNRIGLAVSGDAKADAERLADAYIDLYEGFGLKNLRETVAEKGYTDDEDSYIKKVIPLFLDDWKSRLWNPPIHEDQAECERICRSIWNDR